MSSKYRPEDKIRAVKDYKAGKGSQGKIAKALGTNWTTLQRWIRLYDCMGENAFYASGHSHYSSELKNKAVQAYLNGEGSYEFICTKFEIRSSSPLKRWVMRYHRHEELKASRTGGSTIMTKGRKTTQDERITIAQYCIEHDRNYSEAAEKFKVSYQQARSYTVKYEAGSTDALKDRRGKSKPEEAMTELDRLRAELKQEKARRQQAEMEVFFLKKIEEIERRRG